MATAGEIAAGLAHEIRNPLATAKAAIQLIRMVKDQVKQEELLNKLERELDRINDILTNFLNISTLGEKTGTGKIIGFARVAIFVKQRGSA